MTTAIRVEGLGKRYTIGHTKEAYRTMRDALAQSALAPIRRIRNFGRASYRAEDTIWALKDASFEVQEGEVLGVIGANGAGKSTLLKILTRITEPTEGHAELRGRVGSLLEVGTGFHPELTGRENIFLSGAVLGLSRNEILRKYDEIVEFSGVEKFLDTPVKRYSSGMKVRLGFSVAAHLEPEILLIDEVLAVGDAAFQRKCIGKMSDVTRTGRTVLFVSHNMNAISRLCERVILLDEGCIKLDGEAEQGIQTYLGFHTQRRGLYEAGRDRGNGPEILDRVELVDERGRTIEADYSNASEFEVRIAIRLEDPEPSGYLSVSVRDRQGIPVLFTDLRDSLEQGLPAGRSEYAVRFPAQLLASGEYTFTIGTSGVAKVARGALQNVVSICLRDFTSTRGEHRLGYFGARLSWTREDA